MPFSLASGAEGLLNAYPRSTRSRMDAGFEVVEQERAPAALWWSNVNGSDARNTLDSIRDPHGRALEIVDSPALGIALGVPRLSRLLEELPVRHFEAPPNLHKFDFVSGRWTRCQDISEPGAYRTIFAGNRYLLKGADGAYAAKVASKLSKHWPQRLNRGCYMATMPREWNSTQR